MVSLFVGQLCIFLHVSLLFLVGLRVVNIPFGRLIECCTYDVNSRKLNFDDITQINPSSALMLVAELDVWNIKSNNRLSSNHKTWHADIKSLLSEMGLFELLKLPPLENNSPTNDATFLKFISGKNSEGEKAKQLRENIERVIGVLSNPEWVTPLK